MESCEGLALEYSAVAYCTGDGSCQNVELKNTAVAICPEKGACEGMTIGPDADCLKDGCPRHELGLDCTDQNVCECPANGPCKDATLVGGFSYLCEEPESCTDTTFVGDGKVSCTGDNSCTNAKFTESVEA